MIRRDVLTPTILTPLLVLALAAPATAQWGGFVDRIDDLNTEDYDFGIADGSNENYYDGDFTDFDLDGRMDRGLISRYGLLWNRGQGIMIPVSSQVAGQQPNTRTSLVGYEFGDEVAIGNDAVQWSDIDGDGDPDNIQGGNGEPFTIQVNRAGRFTTRIKHDSSALNIANTDIERDGDVDLVVAHAFCSDDDCGGPIDFSLWVNDGSGNFTEESVTRGLDHAGDFIFGVVSGDLDSDGDFDLVLLNGAAGEITLAMNDGDGQYVESGLAYARGGGGRVGGGFGQHVTLGDIDDDGDLDMLLAVITAVSSHREVYHVIFVNDGSGNFTEESQDRWDDAGEKKLSGEHAKLVDFDYDDDLDFVAYQKEGPHFLQLYTNDGDGFFTYRPDLVADMAFSDDQAFGSDMDISDIDGDGSYDIWVGAANQRVHPVINTWRDPSGVPADLPRGFRIEAQDATGITLAWEPPPWAPLNRHYKVYRSEASRMGPLDRHVQKVIARSPHEDDSFAAPLSRHTTAAELADPDVAIDSATGTVRYTDRTAVAGVSYRYAVVHVGTERNASRPTDELTAMVPAIPGSDDSPPELTIVSPTDQQWSTFPRVILTYGDGGSGIDLDSLRVSFDVPLGTGDVATGGRPADADISDIFQRKDATTYQLVLTGPLEVPLGLVRLSASISDRAGNTAVDDVLFFTSVYSDLRPTAAFTVTETGMRAYRLDGSASSDPDGEVMRWEWYFGDGRTAIGSTVDHVFAASGDYPVMLVVRDNDGGVAAATETIAIPANCGVPPGAVSGLKVVKRADGGLDGSWLAEPAAAGYRAYGVAVADQIPAARGPLVPLCDVVGTACELGRIGVGAAEFYQVVGLCADDPAVEGPN